MLPTPHGPSDPALPEPTGDDTVDEGRTPDEGALQRVVEHLADVPDDGAADDGSGTPDLDEHGVADGATQDQDDTERADATVPDDMSTQDPAPLPTDGTGAPEAAATPAAAPPTPAPGASAADAADGARPAAPDGAGTADDEADDTDRAPSAPVAPEETAPDDTGPAEGSQESAGTEPEAATDEPDATATDEPAEAAAPAPPEAATSATQPAAATPVPTPGTPTVPTPVPPPDDAVPVAPTSPAAPAPVEVGPVAAALSDTRHRIDDLNAAELLFLGQQRGLVAELCPDTTDAAAVGALFDRVHAQWVAAEDKPDPQPLADAFGVALGDLLSARLPALTWAAFTDRFGTEIVLAHRDPEVVVYPIAAVAQDWATAGPGWLVQHLETVATSLAPRLQATTP